MVHPWKQYCILETVRVQVGHNVLKKKKRMKKNVWSFAIHLQLWCFKRGTTAFLLYIKAFSHTCRSSNSVTPVHGHLSHWLASSHQFSGHLWWPTAKVNFFFFFLAFHVSEFQHRKVLPYDVFCCYCVKLFCSPYVLSTFHQT